ncbi:lipopolysaccharide biosynthesis protein [Aquimarina sp. 2201CG14-23]|uniref:lipopolysaccharide biosynthesis protein n=1 Tax=Aquimarina mycalae TaxID=3040073 RepID=UPI0024780062|nr:oligosaccharide flippase family protein [Aquimarina sp. 2201CG14-23]MDH7446373.1 oligosaccharide flippase family protein [Aquimarina sp. 2201CG14-23]
MVNFVKRKFHETVKNEFVKHVLTLISGTSIAQFIPIAISPILTRIYTPQDFSVLGIYISIAIILSEITTGKFELAIMNADDEDEKTNIISLAILVIGITGLFFGLLFFLFFEKISFLNVTGSVYWKYLLVPTIAFLGIVKLFTFTNIKKKRYKTISLSKVTRSIFQSTIQIGLYSFKYFGLLIGFFVSSIVEGIVLCSGNRKYIKRIKYVQLKATAKRYAKFPLFDVPSSLFNIGTIQAPILLIPHYFGALYGGFYFHAYKVLMMPISIIGGAIGQVFFEQGSLLKKNKKEFSELVFSTHKKLLFLSFVPLLIILVFGDHIFAFVFGDEWRVAGTYAMLMIPWIFLNFLVSPITFIITIYEKQQIGFIFLSLMSVLRLIALLMGIFYFRDAYMTVMLFGYLSAISYFIYATFMINRYTDIGVLKYWLIVIKYGVSFYLVLFLADYLFRMY